MGRVIDGEIAEDKTIACHGYRYVDPKTKESRFLLWKPGVIGTLSDKQELQFCDKEVSDIKDGLPRRLEKRFQILRGLEKLEKECPCITGIEKEKLYELIDRSSISTAGKRSLKDSIGSIRTC